MIASEVATFGMVLRRHRLVASLSQEALAERARLSPTTVASLERGRRAAPRADTVGLLADALGLSQSERAAFVASAVSVRADGLPRPSAQSMPVGMAFPLPVPATP